MCVLDGERGKSRRGRGGFEDTGRADEGVSLRRDVSWAIVTGRPSVFDMPWVFEAVRIMEGRIAVYQTS
jgi:hypothetical protein